MAIILEFLNERENRMLTYSVCSEIGDRSENEDSVDVCLTDDRQFFFLADGLGGHGNGKTASLSVVQNGKECITGKAACDMIHCFGSIFFDGQAKLHELQQTNPNMKNMRTTLVVLGIEDGKASIAHIGDSRAYVFYNGKIKYRSLDHSVPQMLVLSGEIKESEIRHHPDRNRLLKCLGDESKEPDFELSEPFEIKKGMSVLLCSDGFWETITEKEMLHTFRWSRSASQWLDKMKRKIKKKNKKIVSQDNYSAIAIWFR